MSEHDTSNTTTNEQHALILKLIQERVAAKLEDLENNRNSNDSLLETLKTEINDLLESGNNINNSLPKPEVVEEASTPKPKPGVKINTDESAIGNVPKTKIPSTTKEVKTGQIEGKDSKGKSEKPQSLNDVSEEKKTEATPKPTKKAEPIKTTKTEPKKTDKPDKTVKKGPTDTKKKEDEKGDTHEEEKHEEDNAADQEQPPEVLALKEANKSLQIINKKDITALAAYAKPPANVEKVVSAVLAVLGEKEGWANAKIVLKKPEFLTKLIKVKAESLSDKVTKKVREILGEPENSEENIAKASMAALSFVKWLNCLIKVRDAKKGPETAETQEKEQEKATEEKVEQKEQKEEPVEEKKEGEIDAAEAVPNKDENSEEALIEACKSALKPLDFNKVQMVTASPNPAPKVVKVFEVICILLGEKASWDNAKKVAKFKDFLKKLENLKPEAVSDKTLTRVKQVIAAEGLKPEALASGNAAAKQLCQWITSFVKLKEITKGPEGTEVKEGNEGESENKEHNAEHAEEKKEDAEGEKDKEKGTKESVKKDPKKGADSKKEAEKNAPKRPVTAAKKDEKKEDKTKGKALKKDEKKEEEAGEGKIEQPEEKKEQEGEAKKDAKKGTDAKATGDSKTTAKRPVTAAKKDEKKEEKKEKEDKTKEAKKEDKEKDTKAVTTPKAAKDKAPKEEKKTSAKTTETKKTEKQTAKPELKAILDTITASDLTELKGMAKPPAQIVDAVNLVSLLVQGKDQPWADLTKAFLTNTVTLHKALNINLSNISQESIDAVNKKITDNNIDENSLRKKSSACVALFKWVKEAIKVSEQLKQNPTEEHKDLNGAAHPHEEHAAQEAPKKEEAEAHAEPHLNGEQAHSAETSHKEEAEKKEEPVKVEQEEQKQEINHQEAFDKLSEALGYNVHDEVTDGNLEHYIKGKFKELEEKIKTLNAQNAELKSAGVSENVEKDKNFVQNENTSELLKTVEKESVTELLGQENWDDETYDILALAFLIKGNNDVPNQSDKDKFKEYIKEKLENEESPAGFLTSLGENTNLDTQKKIKLQDFLKGKQSILDFQAANAFSKGAAAIAKEVCEHLGVVPAESATETSVKERVFAFNEEKIAMYNLKENKIIEIAHKYNVALDS